MTPQRITSWACLGRWFSGHSLFALLLPVYTSTDRICSTVTPRRFTSWRVCPSRWFSGHSLFALYLLACLSKSMILRSFTLCTVPAAWRVCLSKLVILRAFTLCVVPAGVMAKSVILSSFTPWTTCIVVCVCIEQVSPTTLCLNRRWHFVRRRSK